MGIFSRIKEFFTRRKPPVLGLALGSGGAKGMAHLGALKAFEEAGISFSVVAGSSIGAITGALYAKGYSVGDMMGIVEGLNRREFSRNLMRPFADLGFAENFLAQYLDGFSDLKKPFAAWVTEADTNCGRAILEGDLPRALTASAAIPPFFRAVEIGGKKYYDGAFSNAVPADICRELGAVMPIKYTEDCRARGYAAADFMLRPNLHDYLATDVSAADMDAMFRIGYEEAKRQTEELERAIGGYRDRRRKKN